MDVSHIRKPSDWPFALPSFTAASIEDWLRGVRDGYYDLGSLLDVVDSSTRDIVDPGQERQIRDYYLRGGWRRDGQVA